MDRMWLVVRHEYLTCVRRRSFLLVLIGTPLAIALLTVLLVGLPRIFPDPTGEFTLGYVDQAGFLQNPVPAAAQHAEGLRARFIAYSTAEQARAALEAQRIAAYFVVPIDYTATLQVDLFYIEELPGALVWQFEDMLRANLLAGRPLEVVIRVLGGTAVEPRMLDGRPMSAGTALGQLLPALAGILLIILIFFGSGSMMQAISEERANRTLEILETSLSPNKLMAGKVLAVVGVNLTQLGAWTALAVLAALIAGTLPTLSWLRDIRIDPGQLLLLAAVALPAYLLLTGLLTAIGALMAEPRSSEQVSGLVIGLYSTMIGMMTPLLRMPDSPVAVGLSLFPLTAPVILPLRAAVSIVPIWQLALSIGLLVGSALAALWLAGRALRLSRLRYGQGLRLGELLGVWAARSRRRAAPRRPAAAAEPAGRAAPRRARHKAWTVLGFELRSGLTKPAYLLVPIGIPLLIIFQLGFSEMAFSGTPSIQVDTGAAQSASAGPTAPQGYVDRSGWVRALPANVPAGQLLAFPDEASARRAIASGQIAGYYVIPADYLLVGEINYVPARYNPLRDEIPSSSLMIWVLHFNLLDGDMAAAARTWYPSRIQETVLTPGQEAGVAPEEDSMWASVLPMMIMLVVYIVIIMSSSFLGRTISEEKSNRLMEWMLVSLNPRHMLSGKTIAWGILGLLQAVLLAGFGYLLLRGLGKLPAVPAGFNLEPALLGWTVVFSLLGYAIYAALTAGAGALIPNWRATRGAPLLILLPALLGFYVGLFSVNTPNSLPLTLASLFPLTAPFTMVLRMVLTDVPLWQPLLAGALIVLATWAVGRSVAAMFHAQNLLSGQPFTMKRYLRALIRQE